MRKHLMALPVLLSALALGAAAPAPAGAATARAVGAGAPAGVVTTSSGTATLARFGGGFRAVRPSFGSRYRSPRYYRRPGYRVRPFHGLGGSILRALGIAYLVHALFGWGAGGGSPFGLLIVVALIAWLVSRTRRRRPYAY